MNESLRAAVAAAYQLMLSEILDKRVNHRQRGVCVNNLLDAIDNASPESQQCRLAILLCSRLEFDSERASHEDLDLLDAAKDVVDLGESRGDWIISDHLHLEFA